ncbi:ABC transporter ATP-binding protein/permease [Paenibacillus thiaminolyticus]|uniref:ABC transporter ATP-binding protein n=1 Tax=Paenibacillus thiaminolyticus TaxID=49283 RepID=UPI00232E329D|nr:ABC transporter ATP-binding protein [Paenibacillus thiaminolyticus]WCF10635.1 ABC transporter ATP-binding protein/permease [Paenibacillus thiaminolyticus]
MRRQKEKKADTVLFILRRIIPVTIKVFPGLMAMLVFVLLIQSAIPLLQVFVTAKSINTIQQLLEGNTGLWIVIAWLAIEGGTRIVAATMLLFEQLLQKKMNFKISFFFEKLVLEKTEKLSLIHYENPHSYDLLAQTSGAGDRGLQIMISFGTICMYSITIIGYMITLFQYSWILSLSVVVLAVPNIVLNLRVSEQRYGQMLLQSPNSRKAFYITHLFKAKDSIKEMKLYQTNKYLIEKWVSIYWKNANEKYNLEKKAGIMGFSFDSIGVLSVFIASALLIHISSTGKLSMGEYVALTIAISTSYGMIKTIAARISRMYEDSLIAKRLYTFLDLPEEEGINSGQKFPEKLSLGIEIRNLSFSYPGHNHPTLNNISCTISPNEKVAIVGYNGAGKSTLIKCLLGLYPVPDGTIFFDGIDINDLDRTSLYENMTAVFQDFVRYNLTVRENVGFGNLSKMNDDAVLEEAASKADIDFFIDQLPHRYDTELGSVFIGGQDISGGQWQRIAISRAFLRESQIVILDEPTSALDPIAESHIFEKMMTITEDKIAIFISHRLSGCRLANRIFVLENGMIAESGTHQELMIEGGCYAEMFEKQSSGYRTAATAI